MSDLVNTQLLELAAEHISYWEGEGIGAVLEQDLNRDDLEALAEHLKQSAILMYDLEFNPEPLTDETMSAWGESIIGDNDAF